MRGVLMTVLLLGSSGLVCGCEKKTEVEAAKTEGQGIKKARFGSLASRTDPELKGTVRIADQSLRVRPFVSHDPHSDLKTNCLKAFDDAKKMDDKKALLCYDRDKRLHATSLRIERYDAKGFEVAREVMAKRNEGAHFLLRASGSLYQILDLAHAARRDGALRPEEIRVLSAYPEKEKHLFEELKYYLPELTVEHIDMKNVQGSQTSPPKTHSLGPHTEDSEHDEHDSKSSAPTK